MLSWDIVPESSRRGGGWPILVISIPSIDTSWSDTGTGMYRLEDNYHIEDKTQKVGVILDYQNSYPIKKNLLEYLVFKLLVDLLVGF